MKTIVKNDWIFATEKGLKELEMILECREKNLFRNKKLPREHLDYDNVLKPALQRNARKTDRFEENIIK